MALISVIVPVYMVERFLSQCIDSILQQTFPDFELILVDDGSPDNCGMICDQYARKDHRIRVIHKENGGVSVARNVALEVASGTYVTFCDSDDYYQPDWLEKLVKAAQTHHADLVVGNYFRVSEDSRVLDQSDQEIGTYAVGQPQEKVSYMISHIFGYKHGWEIWNRLFRLGIIKKHGIKYCDSCSNFAEDLGFVLEYLLYANQVLSIEATGYCYRMRQGSMMHTTQQTVRLDSVNEVGLQYMAAAKDVFPTDAQKVLPMIFFLIMNNQYSRIIGTDRYPRIKQELRKIRQYSKWKAYTKAIFRCKKQLRFYFGKVRTSQFLMFCRYCLHGNWKLFCLESVVFRRIHRIR